MSHAFAIAGRELAEKRFVLYAAIAFALLAALMPLVPGLHSSPRDVIGLTSWVLTAGFTLGVAGILGANIVGRDLSAGRLSFYFARPVAATAIWFGKLAAAAVLVAGSFLIVLMPAIVATNGQLSHAAPMTFGELVAATAAAALLFFFVAHALSTMIRSRSILIGLDFAAAVAAGAIFWRLAQPLLWAFNALRVLVLGFAAAVLIAFLIAGAWQLADGRADRRRSHRAFSIAFWASVAAALVIAAAFVGWIVSARPGDIERLSSVQASPRGDWAIVSGVARHRFDFMPTFLIDPATGDGRRLEHSADAFFSADGTKFLDRRLDYQTSEVIVLDTKTGRETETGVVMPRFGMRAVVPSDDFSHFAASDGQTLTVYDLANHRVAGAARVPSMPMRMYFAAPGVVRFYNMTKTNVTAYEFDAAHHALRQTGSFDGSAYMLRVSADGTRLIAVDGSQTAVVRDARTLQPLATVALPAPSKRVELLRDGRIVAVQKTTLYVAGTPQKIELGGVPWAVHDLGGGKVALSLFGGGTHWVEVVDLDRGAVVRREPKLAFAVPSFSSQYDPRAALWNPNMVVTRGQSLLRWNALTGETKVLIE